MKDKEMIEEMAKAMCPSYESGKGCNTCPTNWCYADECATMAFYNDYRNCKDKVVLTKEEYDKYIELKNKIDKSGIFSLIREEQAEACKEMAREMLGDFCDLILLHSGRLVVSDLDELSKKYNVEMGE